MDASAAPESEYPFICPLCFKRQKTQHGHNQHYDSKVCRKERERRIKLDSSPPAPTANPTLPLDQLLRQLKQNVVVLRSVPTGARNVVAHELSAVINDCYTKNDMPSWTRLLTFPYNVLQKPTKKVKNLTTFVKGNVNCHSAAGIEKPKSAKSASSDETLKRLVEAKMEDGDISGAVRLLTSDDSIAPDTPDTLNALHEKHPPPPAGLSFPPEPEENRHIAEVTPDDVLREVLSFPNGSAGGMDGWRPRHLRLLLSGNQPYATTLRQNVAKLCDLMLQGKVLPAVLPFLYGASLTALKKASGGIRPIAVGSTFRRLAAKVVCSRVMTEMGELLRPVQLGFGTRGGCEAAVHATRHFLSTQSDVCRVLLKLDFSNAFNTVRRDRLLEIVRQEMPDYYAFVWQLYRQPTHLQYREHVLSSATGVQQGDPLGPLLFCLAIRNMSTSLTSPLNLWYLDDGTIGGDIDTVCDDLAAVLGGAAALGMSLNLTKCEYHVFGGDDHSRTSAVKQLLETAPDLIQPNDDELTLLGSPLLHGGIPLAIEQKRVNATRLTGRLHLLHRHQALYLLRHCLAVPKVMYLLRTAPAWCFPNELNRFDDTMRSAVEAVTNVLMTASVWSQASLPIALGGLGVRRTVDISLPAYLASISAAKSLIASLVPDVDFDDLLAEPTVHWQDRVAPNTQLPPPDKRKLQQHWDLPVSQRIMYGLLDDSCRDRGNRARLLAVSAKDASCWLDALPASFAGNLMEDDAFRVAVALRLGADICTPHLCHCGAQVDRKGLHGLSCGSKTSGRLSRHNSINQIICQSLKSAGFESEMEPVGLCRTDGKRVDGRTKVPWRSGKHLLWDVTVRDTLATSYIAVTSQEPGKLANMAEADKVVKYQELLAQYHFSPIGLESCGPWGQEAASLVYIIGKALKEKTGDPRSTVFLKQRISVALQRGNAACILGTFPFSSGLEGVFEILCV